MNMARLFPPLPIRTDETHWSWAARMAAFHIRGPIGTFLRDLGLDPYLLSIGDPDELAHLCAIAGQDPEPVLRNTVTQNNRRSWRLGGRSVDRQPVPAAGAALLSGLSGRGRYGRHGGGRSGYCHSPARKAGLANEADPFLPETQAAVDPPGSA